MNEIAKNYMLNQLASVATKASLHNESGVELSGGGYARRTITWGSASGGVLSDISIPSFSVPSGATIAQVKLWNTLGTIEYATFAVASETFANQGAYQINDLTVDLNK